MAGLRLSQLWRYPVKSMRGNRHTRLRVSARGFDGDRQWMLVDGDGRFLTQRQLPEMVLIKTQLQDGRLTLSVPGHAPMLVDDQHSEHRDVTIWRDQCRATVVDPAIDAVLSKFLQTTCSLVTLPARAVRPVDPAFSRPGDQVGFADGFPFLLISQASLDDVNSRLSEPVTIERFRPNLVVEGCAAFAEDDWQRLRIGDIEFRVSKPCSRCVIPSVRPETAQRDKAILPVLAAYRRRDNKIYLGQNLIHDQPGSLSEGDDVEVLA